MKLFPTVPCKLCPLRRRRVAQTLSVVAVVLLAVLIGKPSSGQVPGIVFANAQLPDRVCLSLGGASFSCTQVNANNDYTRGVASADFDGINGPDLALAMSFQQNQYCLNNGSGAFTCSNISPASDTNLKTAVGDFDGVNGPDIVFATEGVGGPNRICLNDGTASFTCSDINTDSFVSVDLEVDDFDGVNGPDVAFINSSAPDRICLNDGSASFICSNITDDAFGWAGMTSGDFDGINGPDLILARPSGISFPSWICLNDGTGGFTCADFTAGGFAAYDAAAADLDGINGLDVIFANYNAENEVCLNDGSGGFTCSDVSADTRTSRSVEAGDLDGANGPDLVFANGLDLNSVCLNDGTASFTCSNVSPEAMNSFGLIIDHFGYTLPVELIHFSAIGDGANVVLHWQTAHETNNSSFEIEAQRSESGAPSWLTLGSVQGRGTTPSPQPYSFRTRELEPGTWQFRLKQIDFDGSFEYSPVVEVYVEVSGSYALSEVYPNPFDGTASLSLAVATEQKVRIELFDTMGRQVMLLKEGNLIASVVTRFEIDGERLAPGTYVVRAVGERFAATKVVVRQ